MDIAIVATLTLSFAVLVTTHVTLAVGLARRHPRWRGALALVVPPLAPYWGFEEGMRRRTVLWVAAVCVYAIALILAAI